MLPVRSSLHDPNRHSGVEQSIAILVLWRDSNAPQRHGVMAIFLIGFDAILNA